MGLAFGVIFLVTALIIACIVLGVLASQASHRLAFFAAAGLLAVVTAAGCWMTIALEEDAPASPAAVEEAAPPPKKGKAAPPSGSGVVLVVDESTITESEDEKNAAPLILEESPAKSGDDARQRQERHRLHRQLRAIEQSLATQTGRLTAQMAAVDQQFQARQITNYEALFQKSALKVKAEDLAITAMEGKLKLLDGAKYLKAEDIGPDRERVQKRLDRARQKREEYQGVLAQLSANAEVFRDL